MTTPSNPIRFLIEPRILTALAKLASKDDSRFVRNGVCVEKRDGGLFAVGCDGRRLGVVKCDMDDADSPFDFSLIIPTTLIKRLSPPKSSKAILVESDGKLITISEQFDRWSISAAAIDGIFPNWRGVVFTTETEPVGKVVLNPRLLRGFLEIAEMLGIDNPGIEMERLKQIAAHDRFSNTAVILKIPAFQEFFGLIMPIDPKGYKPGPTVPLWVRKVEEKVVEKEPASDEPTPAA